MAEEKKLAGKELTDEQANEATGGYLRTTAQASAEISTCYRCRKTLPVDETLITVINGKRCRVCFECAGVR